MAQVEVVVAHAERATLRIGALFLKVDGDERRLDAEVAAMALAPIPTPAVRWRRGPVLALDELPGSPLGLLGEPSRASAAAWRAAGAVVRTLHVAPLPPWPGTSRAEMGRRLDTECAALVAEGVLPASLIETNRRIAEQALRAWRIVFAHGDLQPVHVFVDRDRVTGVLEWSEAGPGDAAADLATLTLGHPEHLADVLEGYGAGIDAEAVRAWWSPRSLTIIRWLREHGFDPFAPGAEVDVLRARG